MMFNGGDALFELFKAWFQRRFDVENKSGRWNGPDKQTRGRITKTIKYAEFVMTTQIRGAIKAPVPDVSDSAYGEWSSNYIQACSALVALVGEELHKLDNKSFRATPTINAVGNRVTQAKIDLA